MTNFDVSYFVGFRRIFKVPGIASDTRRPRIPENEILGSLLRHTLNAFIYPVRNSDTIQKNASVGLVSNSRGTREHLRWISNWPFRRFYAIFAVPVRFSRHVISTFENIHAANNTKTRYGARYFFTTCTITRRRRRQIICGEQTRTDVTAPVNRDEFRKTRPTNGSYGLDTANVDGLNQNGRRYTFYR